MNIPPHGPFESEDQALAESAVQAVYEAFRRSPGQGKMQAGGAAMIEDACKRAGITLGAYDLKIIRWLAGFEPQACAVIAGLVARAAGRGGEQLAEIKLVLDAFDWEVSDRQYALEAIDDIIRGGESA
jgi:hypothetical protein